MYVISHAYYVLCVLCHVCYVMYITLRYAYYAMHACMCMYVYLPLSLSLPVFLSPVGMLCVCVCVCARARVVRLAELDFPRTRTLGMKRDRRGGGRKSRHVHLCCFMASTGGNHVALSGGGNRLRVCQRRRDGERRGVEVNVHTHACMHCIICIT